MKDSFLYTNVLLWYMCFLQFICICSEPSNGKEQSLHTVARTSFDREIQFSFASYGINYHWNIIYYFLAFNVNYLKKILWINWPLNYIYCNKINISASTNCACLVQRFLHEVFLINLITKRSVQCSEVPGLANIIERLGYRL